MERERGGQYTCARILRTDERNSWMASAPCVTTGGAGRAPIMSVTCVAYENRFEEDERMEIVSRIRGEKRKIRNFLDPFYLKIKIFPGGRGAVGRKIASK